MPTLLRAAALIALLLAANPSFALTTESGRFTNSDGTAKFDDPDEQQPTLLAPSNGNTQNDEYPRYDTRRLTAPSAVTGSSDDMQNDSAFMRGYNRFGNSR